MAEGVVETDNDAVCSLESVSLAEGDAVTDLDLAPAEGVTLNDGRDADHSCDNETVLLPDRACDDEVLLPCEGEGDCDRD